METLIQKLFSFFYFILSFPFKIKWEYGISTQLSLNASSIKYKLFLLTSIFSIINFATTTAFLIKCLPTYVALKQFDKLAFHGIWIIFALSFVNTEYPYVRQPTEVLQLSNGVHCLIKNVEKFHFEPGAFAKSQIVRTRILYYLSLNCLSSTLSYWPLIYYHFRQEYWQPGSYVYRLVLLTTNESEDDDVLASFLGVGFDLWMLFYAWGGYLFTLHLNLAFMHTFKTAVVLMLSRKEKMRRTSLASNPTKVKILQENLFIYSKLRVLNTVFNNVFGMTYVPTMKTILCVMVSSSVFITVRLAPKSNLLVGIFGVSLSSIGSICLLMFITFTAMVNEYSVKFGKYLRNGAFHGKLGRRLVKTFREEAVKSGEFYYIQRMTCLTVLGLLSNMCGSILISIKV